MILTVTYGNHVIYAKNLGVDGDIVYLPAHMTMFL